MGPYSLLDLTIFLASVTRFDHCAADSEAQPHSAGFAGFWALDAENTIIYCSNYNVLYAFMEQPQDGGGTAARAASKTRRVTANRKGLKIMAAHSQLKQKG